ncbi:MAG TPA: hypothetical protein VI483_01105 [Candidatus Paceibacterota bacterium]
MDIKDTAQAVSAKYHPLAQAEGDIVTIQFGLGVVRLQIQKCEKQSRREAAAWLATQFNARNRCIPSASAVGSSVTMECAELGKTTINVIHAHSSTVERIARLVAATIKM